MEVARVIDECPMPCLHHFRRGRCDFQISDIQSCFQVCSTQHQWWSRKYYTVQARFWWVVVCMRCRHHILFDRSLAAATALDRKAYSRCMLNIIDSFAAPSERARNLKVVACPWLERLEEW